MVYIDAEGEYRAKGECTFEEEGHGELQLIYNDGAFYNQTTLAEIRDRVDKLV